MQLHVLGPAFGLPSIDAECIAAVALLKLRLAEGWSIIPTHDQTRRLPYLVDEDVYIEGFKSIRRHIEKTQPDNSESLDSNQRADSTAISSFLEANGQTLLDISLYVSFENYSATRSSFTKILPWHANYIIPPKRRDAARTRTEHLGISSIDVDDVHDDLSNKPQGMEVGKDKKFEAETQQRASLLLGGRKTVTSLLQRPEHSAVFKLHALADNFFGSLQDIIGNKTYFLGTDEPQAVDCLAYGYLSLMLYPKVPQDWLAKTMKKKYPKLVRFTQKMHEKLQMQTDVGEVMYLAQCKNEEEANALKKACCMTLPWKRPATSTLFDVSTTISSDLFSRIPLLGPGAQLVPVIPQKLKFWQRYFPALLLGSACSIGLLGYYSVLTGLIVWPHGEDVQIFGRRRLADYGHLGAALAGVSLLGHQPDRAPV